MKKLLIVSCLFLFFSAPLFSTSVKKALNTIDSLLNDFSLVEALQLLDKLEQDNPKSFEISYKKGLAYLGLSKYKLAIEAYKSCIKIKPKNPEPYEVLGNLYAQFKDSKRSIQNFQKAYLNTTEIHDKLRYKIEILNMMLVFKDLKDFEKHVVDANEIAPNNFDINFMYAKYYNELEDYEKAEKILQKLIKQVPNVVGNEQYFYELGLALHFLGRYQESASILKNANRSEYKNRVKKLSVIYYISLAKAYKEIRDYDRTFYYLDIASKLNNNIPDIRSIRSEIARITQDQSQKINILETTLKAAKPNDNVTNKKVELTFLKFKSGDYSETVFLCDEILALDIKNVSVLSLKAIAQYKAGEYDPYTTETIAKLAFNNNIAATKRSVFAFTAGVIYYKNNELDLAKQMLKKARTNFFKDASTDLLVKIYKKERYGELWKGYKEDSQEEED